MNLIKYKYCVTVWGDIKVLKDDVHKIKGNTSK